MKSSPHKKPFSHGSDNSQRLSSPLSSSRSPAVRAKPETSFKTLVNEVEGATKSRVRKLFLDRIEAKADLGDSTATEDDLLSSPTSK